MRTGPRGAVFFTTGLASDFFLRTGFVAAWATSVTGVVFSGKAADDFLAAAFRVIFSVPGGGSVEGGLEMEGETLAEDFLPEDDLAMPDASYFGSEGKALLID